MVAKDVRLIEYSERVDFFNCVTHAICAVLSVIGFAVMVFRADGARKIISAVLFGASLISVYTVSAVYHGLKSGEAKRNARLADHSAIPFLIAGTATPCALITLYEISIPHSLAVLILAWFCAAFGLISKLFFFEKLRKVTVAVYIISCFFMVCCAVPLLGEIDADAFYGILLGNAFYLIGAAFCGLGIKRPALHVVFHVFCFLASLTHYLVIFKYVI